MSDLPPIVDEADLILAKLAKLDLTAAQHVHACLLDTVEPEPVAKLAHAYSRLSRSCRQTLACLTKLKAERARAEREAEKHERWRKEGRPFAGDGPWKTDDDIAAETRAARLDEAMGRVISHVAAGDKERHTTLVHRFDRELDDWYEQEDFHLQAFDAQMRRACRALDLPQDLATRWHTLPNPTFYPDPEVRADEGEDWRDDAERDDAAPPPHPRTDTG